MACPVCSEDGEHFRATPKAEAYHFLARMLWAAHRARQALEVLGQTRKAALVTVLIEHLDSMREETLPDRSH